MIYFKGLRIELVYHAQFRTSNSDTTAAPALYIVGQ